MKCFKHFWAKHSHLTISKRNQALIQPKRHYDHGKLFQGDLWWPPNFPCHFHPLFWLIPFWKCHFLVEHVIFGWKGVEMAGEVWGATIGHPGTVSNGPNDWSNGRTAWFFFSVSCLINLEIIFDVFGNFRNILIYLEYLW